MKEYLNLLYYLFKFFAIATAAALLLWRLADSYIHPKPLRHKMQALLAALLLSPALLTGEGGIALVPFAMTLIYGHYNIIFWYNFLFSLMLGLAVYRGLDKGFTMRGVCIAAGLLLMFAAAALVQL